MKPLMFGALMLLCLWLSPALTGAQTRNQGQAQQDKADDDDDENLRDLVNDRFTKRRPKGRTQRAQSQPAATSPSAVRNSRISTQHTEPQAPLKNSYRRAPYSPRPLGPVQIPQQRPSRLVKVAPKVTTVEKLVGITVWRFRPSVAGDQERELIHDKVITTPEEWTPVREEAETPFTEGERVRLSVESPATGYLYVIDREQYADGSLGRPLLIFPTWRTRKGNNLLEAGRVIEIPSQLDSPPYLTLRPSGERPDQVGELLTVIVSETDLRLKIEENASYLEVETVLAWERKWQSPTERIEQVGGAGKPLTSAEHEAGGSTSRELVQDEPLPQTIYLVSTTPGNPLLISLSLPFKGPATGNKENPFSPISCRAAFARLGEARKLRRRAGQHAMKSWSVRERLNQQGND